MAAALAQAGVIRSRWDFLLARALSPTRQAPRRRIPLQSAGIAARSLRPHCARRRRSITRWWCRKAGTCSISPPPPRIWDFSPAPEFLDAARDPSLIRDLDPAAPTLEGYLFPSTYRLGRHTTPAALCRMMTARFREAWSGLEVAAPVHRTVTLASLVEKESKLPAERPRMAAVFANRLRLGMTLDCDPSTIYAALVEQRYRGTIHRSDLAKRQPV